jgi:hypothetical protein
MQGRENLRRTLCGSAVILTLAFSSAGAHAQEPRADRAAAEALFDSGLALLKAGKYEEACPKLESSQGIDPAVGTLMYLGECYARLGRTASAWAAFREAASMARALRQLDRTKTATERAEKLEAELCYLRVVVPPTLGQLELSIERNGVVVPAELYGVEVPVDPGTITVKASAKGREEFSEVVTLGAKDRKTVTLRGLAPKPGAETEASPAVAPGGTGAPASESAAPAGSSSESSVTTDSLQVAGTSKRTIALTLGAVGVVGLGVGTFFGVKAIGKNSDAEKRCAGASCDQAGLDLTNEAEDAALISNIAFGAGLALVAAGVVLYVMAPSSAGESVALSPALAPGGGGLSLSGAF